MARTRPETRAERKIREINKERKKKKQAMLEYYWCEYCGIFVLGSKPSFTPPLCGFCTGMYTKNYIKKEEGRYYVR